MGGRQSRSVSLHQRSRCRWYRNRWRRVAPRVRQHAGPCRMAGHDEGKQLLMRLDRRRLRYPLVMERGICGKAVIDRLHEPESSMFIHGRLILRRRIPVVYISPPVRSAEAVLGAIVVLVVHADLRHYGVMHFPEGSGVSQCIRRARSASVSRMCERTRSEGVDVGDVPG
jgi:hypothetical protein